jgi:hypothetical protein
MNPLLKIVNGAVAVIALVIVGMNAYRATRTDYEHRLAREELRAQYLERSALVRALPDPATYSDEATELFRWYFAGWNQIQERFPSHGGGEVKYLDDLAERAGDGKLSADERAAYEASYRQVRDLWDLLRAGKYRPAMTGVDGTLRLDFLEFAPGTIEGQKAIQGRFVLWGAQRRRADEKTAGWGARPDANVGRIDVQAEFKDVRLRLFDKDGRQIAEATFNLPAGPYVPYPESKIEDFPPMAFIGGFAFPALPAEAERAEIETSVVTRTATGRDVEAHFRWTRDVPADWRLPAGQAWDGAAVEEREDLAVPAKAQR